MRVHSILVSFLIATLVLLLGLSHAQARPQYFKRFIDVYPELARQARGVKCNVCHAGKSKRNRNAYGKLLKKVLKKRNVKNPGEIEEALEAVDQWKPKGLPLKNVKSLGVYMRRGQLPGAVLQRWRKMAARQAAAAKAKAAHKAADVRKALQRLVADITGKALPDFESELLSGKKLSSKALSGRIVVLHFWEYTSSAKDSHGQVGFVDFVARQWQRRGVKFYGVAVNAGLADDKTTKTARRNIRKHVRLLNPGYPVLLDDGKLIQKLGDPRAKGGHLPLFLVIDRKGHIVHYHPGIYERPVKELESAINAAGRSSVESK